jgi:hypothetical protein
LPLGGATVKRLQIIVALAFFFSKISCWFYVILQFL